MAAGHSLEVRVSQPHLFYYLMKTVGKRVHYLFCKIMSKLVERNELCWKERRYIMKTRR